jgi:hypothetical protein
MNDYRQGQDGSFAAIADRRREIAKGQDQTPNPKAQSLARTHEATLHAPDFNHHLKSGTGSFAAIANRQWRMANSSGPLPPQALRGQGHPRPGQPKQAGKPDSCESATLGAKLVYGC